MLIGFGLVANTRILVLDEPTNSLGIPSRGQFRKLIASIMETNRLVLVSTHQVCDLDINIDEEAHGSLPGGLVSRLAQE